MLSMVDELFLLALDEEKGNIVPIAKKTLAFGLSGAILAELALKGKVCSTEKHRLELVDTSPTGDDILDETLHEIQSSEKPRKLVYWVSQMSDKPKKLRERLGESLVAKNVVYMEDKRFFRGLPSPEDVQPAVPSKYEIKDHLRAMILANGDSDYHSLALLEVASGSELIGLIFTQDELGIARNRIHEQVMRSALENPAMQTVEDIEQAVSSSLEDSMD